MPEPKEFDKALSNWTPSPETPLAPVRCVTVESNGVRCEYEAIEGQNRCLKHGASTTEAHKVIGAARKRLLGMTNTALETFDDVMKNSVNDSARIKAASEVLNRAGVKEDTNINIQVEDKTEARSAVLDRLAQMKLEDTEIEDAEVVDEPDDN